MRPDLSLILIFLELTSAFIRPSNCEKKKRLSTFLWTIEGPKRTSVSYFFGTIHVPYTHVWEYVSPSVKMAFRRSSSIFFELDLHNPDTIRTLSKCQLLPQEETLSEHLPADLFSRLDKHLQYIRTVFPSWLPGSSAQHADFIYKSIAGSWKSRRPVWILLMLNSLTPADIQQKGVPVLDLFLAQEAQSLSKDIGAVERAEEQCRPLNSLNMTQVILALDHTLRRHEQLRFEGHQLQASSSSDLIDHYNCGSLNAEIFNKDSLQLPTMSDQPSAKDIDAYFRTELIDKRNIRMAHRVIWLLQNEPQHSFFFAFGAGHFLGDNSLLDLIRAAGFKVEPVFEKMEHKKRKFGISWRQSSGKRTQAQRDAAPQFQDLWVRLDNFSPKPWQEIEFGAQSTASPKFYNRLRGAAANRSHLTKFSTVFLAFLLLFLAKR